MSNPGPIRLRYEGEGEFKPASSYWARRADLNYVIGEVYDMDRHAERSSAFHRAFFASIRAAHQSLPDDLLQRFPNEDSLRRYALIKTGHCNQNTFTCQTKAEALRLAKFLQPLDDYGVIDVRGTVVTRYVARSQDYRSMDKVQFAKSAEDVLRVISEMLGVDVATLGRQEAAA